MHSGFSAHAAYCSLNGRLTNPISIIECDGYIPVPRLHLPVGLGRASCSAFFFAHRLRPSPDTAPHASPLFQHYAHVLCVLVLDQLTETRSCNDWFTTWINQGRLDDAFLQNFSTHRPFGRQHIRASQRAIPLLHQYGRSRHHTSPARPIDARSSKCADLSAVRH